MGKLFRKQTKNFVSHYKSDLRKFAHVFAFFFKSQMCIFLGESVHFYPLFIPRGSSHLIWDNFKRVTRYLQRAIFGHNWHHIRPRDGPNPSTSHLPLPPPPQVTISGQPHFRRPRISPPKPADRIDIDIDYMISSNPSLMFAQIYTFF